MRHQPDILFIQVDQMAAGPLPFHGGRIVRAPHLQALADAGTVFDAAYCNSPICAPSRFSMMTGRLPTAIGAYDNASELPAATPTLAHYLRSAGYRTVLDGKMHFVGPDQLHGFEERRTTDIYPADFGWTPNWLQPDERIDWWFLGQLRYLQRVLLAGNVAGRISQFQLDRRLPIRPFPRSRGIGFRAKHQPNRHLSEREGIPDRLRQVTDVRAVEQVRAIGDQHDRRRVGAHLGRVIDTRYSVVTYRRAVGFHRLLDNPV